MQILKCKGLFLKIGKSAKLQTVSFELPMGQKLRNWYTVTKIGKHTETGPVDACLNQHVSN